MNEIEITGHSDCPLWCGGSGCCYWDEVVRPEWYRSKTGGYRLVRTGKWRMRRPRKCPAKKSVLVVIKKAGV